MTGRLRANVAMGAGLWAAITTMATPAVDTSGILETLRRQHDLPALAVVVVKDGHICDRAAVGVRMLGRSERVTTNDLFHIGSCTKSMTATLAAILIEERRLRWDSTVGEMFPEWKGKTDRRYEGVTLEQLLTNRGGCPNEAPPKAWTRALLREGPVPRQRADFVQSVLAAEPAAPPGTKFIYSNQGFTVAGAMLEKAAGKDWEALLSEKLFRPLGMTTAGFGVPGTPGDVDQPWGHTRGLLKTKPLQLDNPPAIGPAGTVHCSLDDLARYVIAHLQRGTGSLALLRPESFRRLHSPPDGEDYACGWASLKRGWAGGQALTHSGSNTMWYLVMWLAPERNFAVLAATNIGGSPAERGCDDVASAMIKKWLPNPPAKPKPSG